MPDSRPVAIGPRRSTTGPPALAQENRILLPVWKDRSPSFRKRQEIIGHDRTDGMRTKISRSRIAASIAKKPVSGNSEHVASGSPKTFFWGAGRSRLSGNGLNSKSCDTLVKPPEIRSRPGAAPAYALGNKPHKDVDAGDLHALRRLREVFHAKAGRVDVCEFAILFEEEMKVVGCLRIEVGLRAFDRDLAEKSGLDELVKRIVDCCERNRNAMVHCFGMHSFGREMPVSPPK